MLMTKIVFIAQAGTAFSADSWAGYENNDENPWVAKVPSQEESDGSEAQSSVDEWAEFDKFSSETDVIIDH